MSEVKQKQKKRNTQHGRPGYLADARDTRQGEKIGGGFFVFRRTSRTGRIRTPEWPFEHPSMEAAQAECDRLSEAHPKEKFIVVAEATIIYAWGDSPDSVTGSWSANTFYDESAEPYVPLAAIAAAYEDAAEAFVVNTIVKLSGTCDLPEAWKLSAYDNLYALTPSDALAALEREKREAKNEALEKAAKYHDETATLLEADDVSSGGNVSNAKTFAKRHRTDAAAIRAMKEPEE